MFLFKKISPFQLYLTSERRAKRSVGFVPTMGALHEGHLALVAQAMQQHECVVCSIFVNPTQFNDTGDLEKYPRTPLKDIEMLAKVGCQVLFMPDVSVVYPTDAKIKSDFSFGNLDKIMEGAFRPGHFKGVAQVVNRLLEIVQPNALYMGQKDYQQVKIVEEMLEQTNSKVQLIMCPTLREPDGLALSSRNVRLNPEIRIDAKIIHQTLLRAKEMAADHFSPKDIQAFAIKNLTIPGFRPEYFEIVDGQTLQPLERWSNGKVPVACTAVWAGDVRLIDNMILI
ncbi:MAG: pantoate--beta-alanine ligase [Saprospiraceae bacterium]|nr:pantoate--beta-alanine ligase [Saprospiraceae bacterium]